ncbi:rhomboid family intramembrane serine protease GlpG [Vibrio palustris]|uniref:Rhomboid protease GlpG n=1 Tax=Vibrio palustris TaxID=1918946 RepID=A0A1R4B846_9VIBR|nr:rhomboid family intramembrane serine protease GlpG [Vibrio palustris]SJL85100.1 Rhomboid protease GlpG [Vibrio palustris]
MIKLVTLNNPRMAQAYIDYMSTHQVVIQLFPEGEGQFSLWLADESQQEFVVAELNAFLHDPTHSKYLAASWSSNNTSRPHLQYASPKLMTMVKERAGAFTLAMMALCTVIFVLQQFGLGSRVFEALHFPSTQAQHWQLWRWVTHALLHFSILHIVFNLLWWWEFGGHIEKRLGSVTLLKIFVVSAVLSGAGQYWVAGANFGGLSGVVYALLGYSWMLSYYLPSAGVKIEKPIIGFMLFWLVLGYVQPFMAIANTAHLAGLIAGVGLGLSDVWRWRQS